MSIFNLTCPITLSTSYGSVAYNIYTNQDFKGCVFGASEKQGVNASVITREMSERLGSNIKVKNFQQHLTPKQEYTSWPNIKIYHASQLEMPGKHRIGWPIFELETFSTKEKYSIASCDELFVCSNWAKQCVEENLGYNIQTSVVPLGVDTNLFCVDETPSTYEKFTFLSCGKWEIRKGHDLLVEAFNEAFSLEENVRLIMVMSNQFRPQHVSIKADEYSRTPLGEKILPVVWPLSTEQLVGVMQNSDCGVFPSCAEGWNMPVLEMMSCGKPVIVSNNTAHSEYCTSENSHLIDTTGPVVANDGYWFNGEGFWRPPVKEHLVSLMRQVFEQGKNQFNLSGRETAERFSWQNTFDRIKSLVH